MVKKVIPQWSDEIVGLLAARFLSLLIFLFLTSLHSSPANPLVVRSGLNINCTNVFSTDRGVKALEHYTKTGFPWFRFSSLQVATRGTREQRHAKNEKQAHA